MKFSTLRRRFQEKNRANVLKRSNSLVSNPTEASTSLLLSNLSLRTSIFSIMQHALSLLLPLSISPLPSLVSLFDVPSSKRRRRHSSPYGHAMLFIPPHAPLVYFISPLYIPLPLSFPDVSSLTLKPSLERDVFTLKPMYFDSPDSMKRE